MQHAHCENEFRWVDEKEIKKKKCLKPKVVFKKILLHSFHENPDV